MNAFGNSARSIATLGLLLVSSAACSPQLTPLLTGTTAREAVYALDGVKLISAHISQGDDPKTYLQRSYEISNETHVLLRFESLTGSSARIQNTKPVRIKVFALNETEKAKALSSLRACPITKNWMMLATWYTAHPWVDGGWNPGGAIDTDDCVSAETTSLTTAVTAAAASNDSSSLADSTVSPCLEAGAVCFDVNAWFNNYVLQRRMNFGIALITADGQPVQIFGDESGSKMPRIHWSE